MYPPMMRPVLVPTRVTLPRSRLYWGVLGLLLLVNFVIAMVGATVSPAFSASSAAWYEALSKPSWAVSPETLALAWNASYVLMAIGAWWVARARPFHASRPALNLYAIQLVLNAAWLPLLFGMKSPVLAFGPVIALLVVLVFTTIEFARRRLAAGLALLPYVAWVAYSALLNYALWHLNSLPG
jgi:translocator protein